MKTLMQDAKPFVPQEVEPFVTSKELHEHTGMTPNYWSQLRYLGTGPRYYAPSPRIIRYRLSEVLAWIESSARTGTAENAS